MVEAGERPSHLFHAVEIDLRDRDGVVQIVCHPDDAPAAHEVAQTLRGEWVVRVTGAVRERPEGMRNPALATGDVEVVAAGIDAPSLEGLAALIEGEIDPDEWVAGLRRAERTREAA